MTDNTDMFSNITENVPHTNAKTVGKKPPTPRLLDINQAIAAVDTNNYGWFTGLSDAAKKQFAAPVFLRWAATVDGKSPDEIAYMLIAINERVNVNMWDLWEHPDLIFRLAATCGLGTKRRVAWIKGPEKKTNTNKVYKFLAELYPFANEAEISLIIRKHTKESFTEFVLHESGCPQEEAKDILKAFEKL